MSEAISNEHQRGSTTSGNITSINGVGTLIYGEGTGVSPYEVTGLIPEQGQPAYRQRTITQSSFKRPTTITEGAYTATFAYDGEYDRTKMTVTCTGAGTVLVRWYAGGRYECESSSAGPKERLYLGGDAYSAPMVLQRSGGGAWTPYLIGRDYLGSITQIATPDGYTVADYRYDPWGRLVNPSTGEPYSPGNEPSLFLNRGFTGHEYLPWFGLFNANARLYDPLLGRFLSSDPYVQDPDFTQNYNRFSYCLNNPLKYTDESGKVLHIIIGAAVGGVANLIGNWKNCSGFWEYFAAFGIGAATGALVAATGGLAAAAGGGALATASVIGVGVASGAVNGATSDIIKQTGENFDGINELDWNSIGMSAAVEGISGGVSAGVGIAMSGVHIPININGTTVESPLLTSFVVGGLAGSAGYVAGGTTAGLLMGQSFNEAFNYSWNGIWTSFWTGGAFSAASTAAYSVANGINPLNGKALNNKLKVYTPPQSLEEQLALEESIYNDGLKIISSEDIRSYEWQGWDKMHYTHYIGGDANHNYGTINVHYYQRMENGVIYKSGFKFKY